MATDGVKIIDGDTAHDTYWGIMDLYDGGVDFKTIDAEFPMQQVEYYDAFDNEIYVTSWALAIWEIGQMTDKRLKFVKSVIEKGACVKEWKELGKERQKVLDRFWKKISQPNEKVRARKKYRKITNLYFQADDLLTFQLKDGNYAVMVCTTINQYRGQCDYVLVPTTYHSTKKPTPSDLLNEHILGRTIGSGYDKKTTLKMQPGLERIWNLKGANGNYFFGLIEHAVTHKDFLSFKDRFEKIGTLKIIDGLKKSGSFGYCDNIERFETMFEDLDAHNKKWGHKRYPVTALCDL